MTTTGGAGQPGVDPAEPHRAAPFEQPQEPSARQLEHLYAHLYGPRQGPPAPSYGPDHPQAVTVLVLGVLGAATFGLLGPVAWVLGGRVVREIDASDGYLGGRGAAQTGRVLGIVSTLLFGGTAVFFVLMLTLFGLLSAGIVSL